MIKYIRNRWKRIVQALFLAAFLAAPTAMVFAEYDSVYGECYAEAGVEITPQDFFKKEARSAFFSEGSDEIDIRRPGTYHIKIGKGIYLFESILHISDTLPPEGQPVSVNLEMGETCDAEDFVNEITDATKVSVSFVTQPDFSLAGAQPIEVVLADAGDNQTLIRSELFISQVVSELTVEAGSRPLALTDFVIKAKEAAFLTDVGAIDYTKPGDISVRVMADGMEYEVPVHILDTVPPKLKVRDIQGFALLPRKAEDFVVSVFDATDVKIRFKEQPDLQKGGVQEVEICAVDAGGNEVRETAKLELEIDTEPPVITGAVDMTVYIGNVVAYKKNVTVSDNCEDGLQFAVDNSGVNTMEEGVYPVTYTAKDFAGNETAVTVNLTVKQRVYTEEEVYALADSVLARIITPEMSVIEKLQAIYNYNKSHINYVSPAEKDNWIKAAYEGLADGKGDCFVYACTAKALLTRAGIPNLDIAKIPSSTKHYWNLVDFGDGWYHFDTTPRKDHPYIFLWTDTQMMEYSAIHYNSHNYDHTQYPAVHQ